MYHLKDPLFFAVFNQLPEARLITKADYPRVTIVASNRANYALLGTQEELSGKSLWDINYPEAFGGNKETLRDTLAEAIKSKQEILLSPLIRRHPPSAEPERKTLWLQIGVRPITEGDQVTYLILTVFDRTREQNDKNRIQHLQNSEELLLAEQEALNAELAAANEELTSINEDLNESQERLLLLNQQLEEKVAERTRELFLSEQKARLLVKEAPVGISLLTGNDLLVESANKKMLEFWNKTEEILGKPLFKVLPELEIPSFRQTIEQVLATGEPYYAHESTGVLWGNKELEEQYYNLVYHPITNESGLPVSILIVASDISAQVKAKKAIEASQVRLERMVMSTPFAMAILKGRDLRIDIANTPMLKIWARTSSDVIGKKLVDVFPELKNQPFPHLLQQVFDTQRKITIPEAETRIVTPDGAVKVHYLDVSYNPLFDSEGNVESILVSVSDISEIIRSRQQLQERQEELEALNEEVTAGNEELVAINEELTASNEELLQAEQELQELYNRLAESEDLFRGIFEQSPLGMCVLRGPNHVVAQANENILRIWGRKAEEVVGLPHQTARPELEGQPVKDWLNEVYHKGTTRIITEFKVYLHAGNGTRREAYLNAVYQPLRDGAGSVYGILVIIQEVTEHVYERKQAEVAHQQFRMAVESASLGTWYMDTDTMEVTFSPRLRELFGFSVDELISFEDFISVITEEYRGRALEAVNDAIVKGEDYDQEFSIKRRNDGKLKWLKATGKVYRPGDTEKANFSGTVQDITERKLEESRKNSFIAMASHELKTPLTSAKAYVQMLAAKAKATGDEFARVSLNKVDTQINKMQALISGFLDVARMESGNLNLNISFFNLNTLIEELVEELRPISPHHQIVIERNTPVEVHADKDKIEQVMDNLLRNAIKYSPEGRKVYLNCTIEDAMVMVSIRDEGIGMTAADMQGLFNRFYRVESPNTAHISGFGVGLYICAEIIKRHKGKIWAESIPGKGSTFYFSLPLP